MAAERATRKAGHAGHGRFWQQMTGSDVTKAMTTDRLDSWKAIATYLNRSVRTVTRWEREEGLPVHRHLHSKSGSVYAYRTELDEWWRNRGEQIDRQAPNLDSSDVPARRYRWMLAVAIVVVLAVSAMVWRIGSWRSFLQSSSESRAASSLMPLTTYPGVEGPPSLSPDGNQVAFERAGDIFVKQADGEALLQLTSTSVLESAPAWSPDGRVIAFTRAGEGIFVISPLGGGERKIAATRSPLLLKTIAWTPDARSLVISELTSPICASLFVISAATGHKTRLTSPPEPSIGDGWPALSPDGRTVAFARYSQDTSANVYVVPLTGGEPHQVTADKASLFGLAWTSNTELVFSSNRGGPSRLWRVFTNTSSSPAIAPLDVAGEDARFPSVSRPGAATPRVRLAYQRFVENVDIRRSEIVGEGTAQHGLKSSERFIASTRSDDHPQYSPDGGRIAFVSNRSGNPEVWVCASDASNPIRLTTMEGPVVVAPRWSPDGRRIAYFATTGRAGSYEAYVVDSDGGRSSRLTGRAGELEALPTWSRDGRWLYLTSNRSGALQIWKVPVAGGDAVQVTKGGGAEASDSPDGRLIYYTKVPEIGPGLWSVLADGGGEDRVIEAVRFGYWAVARRGIYFLDFDVPSDAPRPVRFFDFQSRHVAQVGTVENTVSWTTTPGFAISPDGRWLLYTSLESIDADLMMVENIR
jgi:Tol biopolymer transport system component